MDQKVKAFYDALAPGYDAEQDEFSFVRKPEMDHALAAIARIARPTDTVLEIGVGTGRFALQIAPLVRQLTGIDLSAQMLDVLRGKALERGVSNLLTCNGDFLAYPFDTCYDLIVSFSAIEYIADKRALFAKIAALLKPGGRVVLTTTHHTFFRWWGRMGNYLRQGIFMQAYGKREMCRLLAANGLRVCEISDLSLRTPVSSGILLFVHAEKI